MPFREAWDLQTDEQRKRVDGKLQVRKGGHVDPLPDLLLFVEHPHVFTLGKSGDASHLLQMEAELVKIDRGGDITYHGPGQVVGYPILDLERRYTDIHRYLRELEEVVIRVCADYGIEAGRAEGMTGVWTPQGKICAMGIRCSRWVTMHGFALNVNTDLRWFGHIVPCGIPDKPVASLQSILGRPVDLLEVKARIVGHMAAVFKADIENPYLQI
jgi:lipoyl(octanoyl) transferase